MKAHKLASPHSAPGDNLFAAPGRRGTDQGVAARAIEARPGSVTVSKAMGHKNANVTLAVYTHEFERQRTADDARTKLAAGFGHLLTARS